MRKNYLLYISMLLIIGCKTADKVLAPARDSDPLPNGETAWSATVDKNMKSLINPPEKIPLFSRFLLKRAEKEFEKELLPGRILTWSTDLGVGSGCLEMFIEKGAAKILPGRLIYLLRMQVSYYVGCSFAIDVNSYKYKDYQITEEEIQGLQGKKRLDEVKTFSDNEIIALQYAVALSQTPVSFEGKLLDDLRRIFSQKEIVAISALAAKVNYWARLIEAWRLKPAGYSNDPILDIDKYNSYK